MKNIIILSIIAAMPILAQDADQAQPSRPEQGQDHRARLIKHFDKDGDGKLSDEEKAEMQRFIEERRKNRPHAGKEGKRPSREDIIKKYDKDEDGKLSDEEKKAMQEDMAKHHPRRGGEGRHGRGRGGDKPQAD